MIPAALSLVVWLPAIWGFGAFVRVRGGPMFRLAISGLAGLATLAAAAVALNLFVALSPALALCALAVGWASFAAQGRRLLAGAGWREAAIILAIVVLLAAVTQFPARYYDAGLYFLPSVRWAQEWPQVRGLASLHPRLGYNSSWFALAAITETPWLVGRSSFYLNTLPILFTALLGVDAASRLRAGDRKASTIYFLLCTIAAAYALDGIASLAPDHPTALLVTASMGLWLRALDDEGAFAEDALTASWLAAFAMTIKISAIVAPAALGALLALRRPRLDRRAWLLVAGGGTAVLVPWLARGLLNSGCFAFPAAATCVAVPWATPRSLVVDISEVIRAWARAPGAPVAEALAGWTWIPRWAEDTLKDLTFALLLLAFAASCAVGRSALWRGRAAFPLLASIVGLAFWFLSAPMPRFGVVYLLPAALLATAAAVEARWEGIGRVGRTAVAALAVASFLGVLHASTLPIRKARRAGYAFASWPPFPTARLVGRVTPSGTELLAPAVGDQCWNAPLPCTPGAPADLMWRGREMVVPRAHPSAATQDH